MERKKYLELCQRYAVGEDERVTYKGVSYHPKSYELSFDNSGKPIHVAILMDMKANSIIKCDLNKVEVLQVD